MYFFQFLIANPTILHLFIGYLFTSSFNNNNYHPIIIHYTLPPRYKFLIPKTHLKTKIKQ